MVCSGLAIYDRGGTIRVTPVYSRVEVDGLGDRIILAKFSACYIQTSFWPGVLGNLAIVLKTDAGELAEVVAFLKSLAQVVELIVGVGG